MLNLVEDVEPTEVTSACTIYIIELFKYKQRILAVHTVSSSIVFKFIVIPEITCR